MNKRILFSKPRQAGFSLVEIMVAVVISMLAMMFVLQIFAGSEANKRATTGVNDANMGGVVAMAGLERDLRQAGYGMTSLDLLGCDVVLPSGATLPRLAPVTINHLSIPQETGSKSDTLLIAYGVGDGMPEGDPINSQPGADAYGVATLPGFKAGDYVVAQASTRPATCTLKIARVKDEADSDTPYLTLRPGEGVTGMMGGRLYNLGQNTDGTGPQVLAYRVHKANLVVCDYMKTDCSDKNKLDDTTVWATVAANIAAMRVQYGRDTTTPLRDNVADIYDQVTPTTGSAAFACDAVRIVAVRLALVARSTEYDKDVVTLAQPTWEASSANNPGMSAIAAIDVTATNWNKYRYKVFQTAVPIRATSWLGSQKDKGCP